MIKVFNYVIFQPTFFTDADFYFTTVFQNLFLFFYIMILKEAFELIKHTNQIRICSDIKCKLLHFLMLAVKMCVLLICRCTTRRGDSCKTESRAASYAKVRFAVLYSLYSWNKKET
jgi:hypothetical protein